MKVFGSEIIENYVLGRLSTEEAQELAAAIEKDPALQQEVELQSQVINSIKEARKTELKARLNNIPVSSGMATSTKIILGTAAVASLLLASWFVFSPNNAEELIYKQETTENVELTNEFIPSESTEITNEEVTEIAISDTKNNATAVESVQTLPTKTETAPTAIKADKPGVNIKPATPFTPNPVDDNESGFASKNEINNVPGNNLGNASNTQINKKIVPVIEHSNKARKYKFDGENLTLIGDFSSDTPYTVYEFNAISGKSLYLKFDNDYYEIKNTESKVVKLDKTTSPEIIKQLENK